MRIEPSKIKNILAVRNDRFGEFLLNIPAFRALKETFSRAKLTVITAPEVEGLARRIPFIDEVTTGIPALRRKNFDIAVMLNPSKEFNIRAYLSGIPIRVGYDRKWGFLLTHKIKDKKHLGEKHEVEYNLELVGLIGAQAQDKRLCLSLPEIASPFTSFGARNDTTPAVALHPWTSDPIKQWPIERFRELALRLGQEAGIKVVIIGGRVEARRQGDLFSGLGNNVINFSGKTTLPELAALLEGCRMLVSCDSGPMHLACCVGTPVVALFRNDIPAKSAKRWGPWGKGHTVIEKKSLLDITVEEVFREVASLARNDKREIFNH